MSEMVSGAAKQIIQQIVENQGLKQQPTTSGKTFEQYLQQDKTLQTQEVEKTTQIQQPEKVQNPTSSTDIRERLNQLEADLAKKTTQPNVSQSELNKKFEELFTTKTRLGFLTDANNKMGNTSKVTDNLAGRFTQVENEYRAVEDIMKSDKSLSQGELLALQARLYQVSQHIEVMSKVVDQMAGGIKTVLNTNI